MGIEAPRAAPARVGAARERAQTGVGPSAAVIDARCGDVAHGRPARAPVTLLPLLLVAAVLQGDIERPHAHERAAADGHVRPPRVTGVRVLRSEVQRGDRRTLPPAAARRAAFQAGPDGPGEDIRARVGAGGAQQRLQPARRGADVVVHEHDQLARGALHAGVAGDIQTQRLGMGLVARVKAGGERAGLGGGAGVIDDQHLRAGGGGLGGDRGERHLQVARTPARGNHD